MFKDGKYEEVPFGLDEEERREVTKPLMVGLVIVLIALLVGTVFALNTCRSTPSYSITTENENKSSNVDEPATNIIYVHVVGCVNNPGVYAVPLGSHVVDVIERAGDFTEEADTTSLNLAREVVDGEQIRVASTLEASSSDATTTSSSLGINAEGKVNINYATTDELQTVSGIGEVTAKKIVEDREKNGPFTSVDDLTRVSGIGEKTLEKMRNSLTV